MGLFEGLAGTPGTAAPGSADSAAGGASPGGDGLERVASALASQHGAESGPAPAGGTPTGKKRGRPIGSKNRPGGGSGGPVDSAEPVGPEVGDGEGGGPVPSGVVLPPGLVSKIAREAALYRERSGRAAIARAAGAAGISDAAKLDELTAAAEFPLGPDTVGEIAPYVLDEWGISASASPTAVLVGLFGLQWWAVNQAVESLKTAKAESPAVSTPPSLENGQGGPFPASGGGVGH